MKKLTLIGSWIIKAPLQEVFDIVTDFEKMPERFPKTAEKITVLKREGDFLEMEALVKGFGSVFPVKMHTHIVLGKGFVTDNKNDKLGISGHEEFLLEETQEGTKIDYIYEVDIHKKWLRTIAKPLFKWFSMKVWEKAFIDELRKIVEK